MYDNFKLLNYSNSLVSPELFARHLSRLFSGNVIDGLTLVPSTGLTVTLNPGNGLIPYGSGATASAREFSLVADFPITLDTADASNPRIDLIVIYVDLAVALPGGTPGAANLDGPGVVKATFVKGTPNASPVDPTVGAIQTKIGAANPYIIVESVRVDATVTTIAANKITDRRVFAQLGAENLEDDSVTSSKLNPSKTVDANGWTVRDYGTWKEYNKLFTWTGSQSVGAHAGFDILGGSVLPVGLSNLTGSFLSFIGSANDRSFDITSTVGSSATSLGFAAINHWSGSITLTAVRVWVTIKA